MDTSQRMGHASKADNEPHTRQKSEEQEMVGALSEENTPMKSSHDDERAYQFRHYHHEHAYIADTTGAGSTHQGIVVGAVWVVLTFVGRGDGNVVGLRGPGAWFRKNSGVKTNLAGETGVTAWFATTSTCRGDVWGSICQEGGG